MDDLFSRLDAGKLALERSLERLSRYRASVLRRAISGSLTAEWRERSPEAESAEDLLKRILTERRRRWEREQLRRYRSKGRHPPKNWRTRYKEPVAPDRDDLPDLPDGWCWATLEQCSHRIQYGSSTKTNAEPNGTPVLRMGNITSDGRLLLDDVKYLPQNHHEFPDLLLHENDLLFNRTNSAELVGKTAIFRGTPAVCSFASYLIRVRLLPGIHPALVASCLNGEFGRRWIRRVVNQTVGQANVNGSKLARFTFPLPPLAEQEQIAGAVSAMESAYSDLEMRIEDLRARGPSLRQALLRSAFDGRLVPQDPKDEPASALLWRIATGRRSREWRAKPLKKKTMRTRCDRVGDAVPVAAREPSG